MNKDIKSDATAVITATPVIKDETPVKPKSTISLNLNFYHRTSKNSTLGLGNH